MRVNTINTNTNYLVELQPYFNSESLNVAQNVQNKYLYHTSKSTRAVDYNLCLNTLTF